MKAAIFDAFRQPPAIREVPDHEFSSIVREVGPLWRQRIPSPAGITAIDLSAG